jgi:hypothetical protein
MANALVLSGKYGLFKWYSNLIYFEKWDLDLKVDMEEYMHFGMTPDANSLIFKQLVDGFSSGTITASGKFDATPGGILPTNKVLYPQVYTNFYIGYNSLLGFVGVGAIESIKTGQGVQSPYATYECSIKVTGLLFSTAGG